MKKIEKKTPPSNPGDRRKKAKNTKLNSRGPIKDDDLFDNHFAFSNVEQTSDPNYVIVRVKFFHTLDNFLFDDIEIPVINDSSPSRIVISATWNPCDPTGKKKDRQISEFDLLVHTSFNNGKHKKLVFQIENKSCRSLLNEDCDIIIPPIP